MADKEILGTICRVVFPENDPEYVYKYPLNTKTKVEELYRRYMGTALKVEDFFHQVCRGGELVIPEMALEADFNRIRQRRVYGTTLGRMSDEQIARLPVHTLRSLEGLIDAVKLMHDMELNFATLRDSHVDPAKIDFVDIFGYDRGLGLIDRLRRCSNVRYSPNIMIGCSDNMVDNSENTVYFVDPDTYYASCRNWLTRLTAASAKPEMFKSMDEFKQRLRSYAER